MAKKGNRVQVILECTEPTINGCPNLFPKSSNTIKIHCIKKCFCIHRTCVTDITSFCIQFKVTTLDLNNLPKKQNNEIDFKKDFFGKETSLTRQRISVIFKVDKT